jgi:hypothetical protein
MEKYCTRCMGIGNLGCECTGEAGKLPPVPECLGCGGTGTVT